MNAATQQGGERRGTFRVVVGLDFSDADGPAFDQASSLARRVAGAELHLLHVFGAPPSEARRRDLAEHLRLYVTEKAAITEGLGGVTVGVHLRAGKPVREILQLASDLDAGLVVLGSHRGPHLKHWLVGSTAEQLIAGARCPVLVATPRPKHEPAQEPTIEPPCPQCVETRFASQGAEWWCGRHAHRASGGGAFSYERELPFAFHDSEVIPTGIDL